jgi:DNA-binding LytR/AlgR family response regulator
MLRCAVCDDEADTLDKVEKLVQNYNRSRCEEANLQVKRYTSPQCLWDEVEEGQSFDVFLLDIEMEELNGITLAEQIRKVDPVAVILLLSSHTEFHVTKKGYRVQALRYISKLAMETDLVEAFDAAAAVCKKAKPAYLTLTHYSDVIRIPVSEIVYVHRVGRMTEVVTQRQGNQRTKHPLRDIFVEIDDGRFIFIIDRGCFVNTDFILQITNHSIILKNQESLPVSRNMLPQVKTALLRLWGEIK